MRIDAFRTAEDFKLHMDRWIRRFRSAEPVKTEVRVVIPGEPEREMEIERMEKGIPLLTAVVNDLQELSKKFKIDL